MTTSSVNPFETLLGELPLIPVAPSKGMLEFEGIPAAVTVLGNDPPSLMWQLKIDSEGRETGPLFDLFVDIPAEFARVSIEAGFVWVSLYNLIGVTSDSHQQLLGLVASAINSTDLAPPAGCARCGDLETAQLTCVEGRPARICATCLNCAVDERNKQEAALNQATVSSTLNLPGTLLAVAAAWAIYWTAIDLLLEWLSIETILIDEFTGLLMAALFGGVGYGLGRPLGLVLRRSLFVSRAPVVIGFLLAGLAFVLGEIGYVALHLLRVAGIFDLGIAARIVTDFVAGYTAFWIGCKVVQALFMAGFCVFAASDRLTSRVEI